MFNLGVGEILVIAIVAILLFGKNLPRVASEAVLAVQKLRRSVNDLRRESGIDAELHDLRRKVETEIVRPVQQSEAVRTARSEAEGVAREMRQLSATSSAVPNSTDATDASAAGAAPNPSASGTADAGGPTS